MNARIDTPAPQPAASIDFDILYSEAISLVHELHFLTADLEEKFRAERGRTCGNDGLTLHFQTSSIDATIWLAGSAWHRAKGLSELLSAAGEALDGKAVQQ